jgi:predicted RNA binding protein with dsRBD fold (UPF0201 family)
VKKAMTSIFHGDVEARWTDEWSGRVTLEGKGLSSLEKLRMILQRDRIRAAARSVLKRSVDGNRMVFFLNKQAAYAGHVSFSVPEGESPLGPITITIQIDTPERLIDWLTGQAEDRTREPNPS